MVDNESDQPSIRERTRSRLDIGQVATVVPLRSISGRAGQETAIIPNG